jgi:hypothetical protein
MNIQPSLLIAELSTFGVSDAVVNIHLFVVNLFHTTDRSLDLVRLHQSNYRIGM